MGESWRASYRTTARHGLSASSSSRQGMIDVRVADKQADNASKGSFRALYEWLTGAASPHHAPERSERSHWSDPAGSVRSLRVVRKLGEGGMGVVYAARDDRLERTVAIKRMRRPPVTRRRGSGSGARRARRRASIIRTSASSTRSAKTTARLFIAMELLEGEPLAERLRAGPLSVRKPCRSALGILAALAALHARGIIHRDLKPSNVFLHAARREAARLRPGAAGAWTRSSAPADRT